MCTRQLLYHRSRPALLFCTIIHGPLPLTLYVRKEATGIFAGDSLLTVNGIPLSSVSLREWIEVSSESISTSTTGQSASSATPPVEDRYVLISLREL